jgi:hypothetical protein
MSDQNLYRRVPTREDKPGRVSMWGYFPVEIDYEAGYHAQPSHSGPVVSIRDVKRIVDAALRVTADE